MSIPAVLGPLRGLGYIILLPLVGITALILLSGYRVSQNLATMWRLATQVTERRFKVARGGGVSLKDFLQPLIDGLECELVVVDLEFRITQYCTPRSRQNKTLEQISIGQRCFEVSHGRNSPCETYELECPLRRVLETNDRVMVTHHHESQLDGKGSQRLVRVLALPIRDSQNNVTKVAELIWDV